MQRFTTSRRQRERHAYWRLLAIAVLATSLAQMAISTAPEGVGAQPTSEPTWARLAASGPSEVHSAEMAYDPISEQLILFNAPGNTWAWDGAAWTQLSPATSPPWRIDPAMAVDPVTGQIILYGGVREDPDTQWMNDTWTWDGSTWEELSPAASPIACDPTGQLCAPGRLSASLAYDPVTEQLILFGGFNGTCDSQIAICIGPLGDTWSWDGSTWQELSPATSPPRRSRAAMAHNPDTDQLILFGGTGFDLCCGNVPMNDTWSWDGSNWVELTPAASPEVRDQMSLAYDPDSGNLLLFGGSDQETLGDTWTWDGANWQELAPITQPFPRTGYALAHNPSTSQLILFGGFTTNIGGADFNDTWSWGFESDQVLTVTINFPDPTRGFLEAWFNAEDMPLIGTVLAADPTGITNISCDGATLSGVTGYGTPFASGTLTKTGPNDISLVTCTATNGDSNSAVPPGANNRLYISIDATLPAILDAGFVSGTPGDNGWYVSPVTHGFSATDTGSDFFTCLYSVTPGQDPASIENDSGDQDGNSVTISSGWCRDEAENLNPGIDSEPYMIDLAAPYDVSFEGGSLTDGEAYFAGFVPNGPTSCTAQDDVSGLDRCDLSGYDTIPGAHTITATAYDVAGNSVQSELTYNVIDWAVELCVSYYTGAVSTAQAGGCASGASTVAVSPESSVTFCINPYTGQMSWSSNGSCTGVSWPHVIPDDGPLHYCENLWTGALRHTYGGSCGSHEVAGVIPG